MQLSADTKAQYIFIKNLQVIKYANAIALSC